MTEHDEPWRCDCPLRNVDEHRSKCLADRLERVERTLLHLRPSVGMDYR